MKDSDLLVLLGELGLKFVENHCLIFSFKSFKCHKSLILLICPSKTEKSGVFEIERPQMGRGVDWWSSSSSDFFDVQSCFKAGYAGASAGFAGIKYRINAYTQLKVMHSNVKSKPKYYFDKYESAVL